jgi:hypothetical protein
LKFALLMNNGPTNYQVHPYSAPVVLPRTARQTSFGGRAQQAEDYFMKGRKQYV